MDDQKTTADSNETSSGPSSRRRIAIGAALLLMGAVIIDPGLLDDANVSVEVKPGTSDQPVDAFEQIELMLAQAEGNKPSLPATTSMPEVTTDTTSREDTTNQTKIPSNTKSMTLMIPGQTMSTDSDHGASLEVQSDDESSAPPVKAVSFPGDVIEIRPEQPSVDSRSVQNSEQREERVAKNIRLLGTIDPHH